MIARNMIRVIAVSCVMLFVAPVHGIDWSYGFGLSVGTRGYGGNANIMSGFSPDHQVAFRVRLIDVVAEDEIRGVDYTYQPVVYNDPRILSIPVSLHYLYHPFYGQIENNFSPFIRIGAGINVTFNGDNGNAGLLKNLKQATRETGLAYYVGGGIKFYLSPAFDIFLSAGYDILPLPEDDPDGFESLDGLVLQIDFQREF